MLPALVCAAIGQHHGDQAAPSSQVVDLNVVALDSKSQPVRDLAPDEVQVLDNGKRQSLAYFRRLDSAARQRPPLGPNQFTNRSDRNLGHPVVILFDQLSQVMGDRGYTAAQLVKNLEPMENADDLYLYILTVAGQIYPVHPLPSGAAAPAPAVPWTRQIRPILDNAVRAVLRTRPVDIDIFARIDLTYRALASLAARMESIPGRKNLVWLSHGVPISLSGARTYDGQPVDYTPALRQLGDALDRAHVAIYPVQLSAPGMIEDSPMANASMGRGGVSAGGGNPAGVNQGSGLGSEDTMQEFAGLTGGRYKGSNDIGEAIRQARSDARTSYQVGFYTEVQPWQGKYHKLKLVSTRKGVRLQGKTGYYAWQPSSPHDEELEAFQGLANAQTDAADIGITAQIPPPAAGARTMRILVAIDAHDVRFSRDQQQYTAHVGIRLVVSLTDGHEAEFPGGELDVSYNEEQYQHALQAGLVTAVEAPLANGMEKIRVMAYDRGYRQVGSVTLSVAK